MWAPRESVIPGGHVVQFRETANALERAGVTVRTATDQEPDLGGIDVVHGFGLLPEHVQFCRSRGAAVALSTIYWDRSYRRSGLGHPTTLRRRIGRVRRAARLARASTRGEGQGIAAAWTEVSEERRFLAAFSAADLLLPNAQGEADAIRADFGVTPPVVVIPNGVDPARFTVTTDGRPRAGILFVGRIEPHKNQLGLINAMKGSGVALTICGPDHPHHAEYADRCRRQGDGWVRFTGFVPDEQLADLYASAKVHVLPTWFETTGLSSLEAALSGCSIVTTSRGHAREYFGELARYCDPADPSSIRNAVTAALAEPAQPAGLRQRILDRYTWDHVAHATLEAYRTIPAVRATLAADRSQ
jgi:glycosyltransferase involved in cell wall biosynthesis